MENFDLPTAGAEKTNVPKLRTSCDACLIAKVKCDKTDAACKRCTSLGTSCQFSPSQRFGKPPSKKTSNGTPKVRPGRGSRTPSSPGQDEGQRRSCTPRQHDGDHTSFQGSPQAHHNTFVPNMTSTTWAPEAPMSTVEMSSGTDHFNAFAPSMHTAFPDGSGLWLQGLDAMPSFDGQALPDLQHQTHHSQHFNFDASMTRFLDNGFTLPNEPPRKRSRPNGGHDCHKLALQTCTELHEGSGKSSKRQQTVNSPPTPPSEGDGREKSAHGHAAAIDTVAHILRCNCVLEEDTILICGSIVFKVMKHFRDILVAINAEEVARTPPVKDGSQADPGGLLSFFNSAKWERDANVMMRQANTLHDLRKIVTVTGLMIDRQTNRGSDEATAELLGVLGRSLRTRLAQAMQDVASITSATARRYSSSTTGQ